MKYSRDAYSKVHMVAIAKLEFEAPPAAEFKYDRYPNGGPERVQSGEGVAAQRSGDDQRLEMGGLEFRADVEGQEGLSKQSRLLAQPEDFLQRPTVGG